MKTQLTLPEKKLEVSVNTRTKLQEIIKSIQGWNEMTLDSNSSSHKETKTYKDNYINKYEKTNIFLFVVLFSDLKDNY